MSKKPKIVGRGRTVIPVISCPDCGCEFHLEYAEGDQRVIKSMCFENFCPVCGLEIDKSTLQDDAHEIMRKEKTLSDIHRN